MTPETRLLIRQLLDGEPVPASVLRESATGDDPALLAAVALVDRGRRSALDRAQALATSAHDRRLVVIAAAYLDGDLDRVDSLARDHLAGHPDSPVVVWLAARARPPHHPLRDVTAPVPPTAGASRPRSRSSRGRIGDRDAPSRRGR